MLNNIKISQTTNEIILNVNVIAEIHEILEELQTKLPKLRDFYKSSTLPMRVTGRLFTESEINRVTSEIQAEINVDNGKANISFELKLIELLVKFKQKLMYQLNLMMYLIC